MDFPEQEWERATPEINPNVLWARRLLVVQNNDAKPYDETGVMYR